MGFSETREFLEQVVREARDPAASYIALKLAGRYGNDDPHARCWQLAKTDEERAIIAKAMLWTIDDAMTHLFMFLELKLDSEVSLTLNKERAEYLVNGCNMLAHWYGEAADDVGKANAQSVMAEVAKAAESSPKV